MHLEIFRHFPTIIRFVSTRKDDSGASPFHKPPRTEQDLATDEKMLDNQLIVKHFLQSG